MALVRNFADPDNGFDRRFDKANSFGLVYGSLDFYWIIAANE